MPEDSLFGPEESSEAEDSSDESASESLKLSEIQGAETSEIAKTARTTSQ